MSRGHVTTSCATIVFHSILSNALHSISANILHTILTSIIFSHTRFTHTHTRHKRHTSSNRLITMLHSNLCNLYGSGRINFAHTPIDDDLLPRQHNAFAITKPCVCVCVYHTQRTDSVRLCARYEYRLSLALSLDDPRYIYIDDIGFSLRATTPHVYACTSPRRRRRRRLSLSKAEQGLLDKHWQ